MFERIKWWLAHFYATRIDTRMMWDETPMTNQYRVEPGDRYFP